MVGEWESDQGRDREEREGRINGEAENGRKEKQAGKGERVEAWERLLGGGDR